MACTITDAGLNLLVSGPTENAVLVELSRWEDVGFSRLGAPVRVGSRWLASLARPGDDTPGSFEIERMGLQVVVRGDTRAIVQTAVENLTTGGAKLIGDINGAPGEWFAVLDAPR